MRNDDMAMRSNDIHWPDGFSPDEADLFSHNEIFIEAPRSQVWRHIGLNAYHTWLLVNQRDGCYVTMEESGKGPGAVAMREAGPDTMHRGHDLWLTRLRALAESTPADGRPAMGGPNS